VQPNVQSPIVHAPLSKALPRGAAVEIDAVMVLGR